MTLFDPSTLVAKGVNILDERSPGWESKINLNTLNIRFSDVCVLAQIFGYDYSGVRAIGLGDGGDITHGFRIDDSTGLDAEAQYLALTTEWKRIILERLHQI